MFYRAPLAVAPFREIKKEVKPELAPEAVRPPTEVVKPEVSGKGPEAGIQAGKKCLQIATFWSKF